SVPVLRDAEAFANSRIRDLSRSAQTAGSELPVVRESDFRGSQVRLLNVPTGANFRATLRVWSSGEPVDFFYVASDQILTFAPIQPPLKPVQAGLRYGTFDLTGFVNANVDHLDLTVSLPKSGARVWAMVSITNNDTQQVTIVSAQ